MRILDKCKCKSATNHFATVKLRYRQRYDRLFFDSIWDLVVLFINHQSIPLNSTLLCHFGFHKMLWYPKNRIQRRLEMTNLAGKWLSDLKIDFVCLCLKISSNWPPSADLRSADATNLSVIFFLKGVFDSCRRQNSLFLNVLQKV